MAITPLHAIKTGLFILTTAVITTACSPNNDFDDAPKISFEEYEKLGNDSAITLTINYKDGDGDLGLRDEQTEPPFDTGSKFHNNLFVKYYESYNGEFRMTTSGPFKQDTISYSYRFPNLTPDSRNKAIEGEISVTIDGIRIASRRFPDRNYNGQIRFEIYIVDRELRQSNTVSSPPISFQ